MAQKVKAVKSLTGGIAHLFKQNKASQEHLNLVLNSEFQMY